MQKSGRTAFQGNWTADSKALRWDVVRMLEESKEGQHSWKVWNEGRHCIRQGQRDRQGLDPVSPWGSGARVWLFLQVQKEAIDLGFKKLSLAAVCLKNPSLKRWFPHLATQAHLQDTVLDLFPGSWVHEKRKLCFQRWIFLIHGSVTTLQQMLLTKWLFYSRLWPSLGRQESGLWLYVDLTCLQA